VQSGRRRRIAIVGLGTHGLAQLERLQGSPERFEVVAVADRSPVAYARLQARHYERRIPFFRTAAPLVALEVDAVLVSATAPAHVPVARELLEAGFRAGLLIEKPLATRVADARSLEETVARDYPGVVAVDFHRRRAKVYRKAAARLRSGELGALERISFATEFPAKLSMKASHQLDVATWLIGSRPVQVQAELVDNSAVDHRGAFYFDPGGRVSIEYANGLRVEVDTTGEHGAPGGMFFRCEHGTIHVSGDERTLSTDDRVDEQTTEFDESENVYAWFEGALDDVAAGRASELLCSVPEAREGLEVLVAAHVSHEAGGAPVALPLPSDAAAKELRIA
jgi:predicted dehydrogenase